MRFPRLTIARPYMLRGLRLWILSRGLLVILLALAETDPFKPGVTVTLGLLSLAIVVGFIDTYRHHERAFLSNLGVSPITLAMLYVIPAVAGEATLQVLAAVT
jgi:hypothetical protein